MVKILDNALLAQNIPPTGTVVEPTDITPPQEVDEVSDVPLISPPETVSLATSRLARDQIQRSIRRIDETTTQAVQRTIEEAPEGSAIAKIRDVGKKSIDLSIQGKGFGRIDEGIIIEINPSKVTRIIGKEGSMINLIKTNTGCNITVGQNGLISISGEKIEDELLAKKAINFVAERSYIDGLTDELKGWFEREKK